jgi:hypothetical protein
MAPTPTRPRQVTLAGWMIILGSAVAVLSAFDRVAGLRSIESQESIREFLSEPPGDGLGLSVGEVLDLIQLLSVVGAACATAAAILGWWVLQGSKQARLALAVLAVPLVLTGVVTGGLVSALVAAAAVMLWLQPARNWFEGRPPPTPATAPAPAPQAPPPSAPPAYPHQFGQPPAPVLGTQPAMVRPARPPAVVGACVLTWICSAAVVLGLGATVLAMVLAPDLLFDELHRQNPELAEEGLSDGDIRAATYVSAAVLIPWCLVAAVLAVQALRGRRWARTALLVSAATAGAISLLGMLASAVTLIPFVACVAAVALLTRPEVRAWYAAR